MEQEQEDDFPVYFGHWLRYNNIPDPYFDKSLELPQIKNVVVNTKEDLDDIIRRMGTTKNRFSLGKIKLKSIHYVTEKTRSIFFIADKLLWCQFKPIKNGYQSKITLFNKENFYVDFENKIISYTDGEETFTVNQDFPAYICVMRE